MCAVEDSELRQETSYRLGGQWWSRKEHGGEEMGWCGLGPREGGWVENEGALEGAVPVGSEGRPGH